jgi:hypothetical protein
MSEIERMWAALNQKFNTNRQWHLLDSMEQMSIIQAVNAILSIIHRR